MENKKSKFLTAGTQECALLCAFLGLLIAVLLLTVGFWKTLMLALFFLCGLFIGGVRDKKACISNLIDRWFGKRVEKVPANVIRAQTEKAEAAADAEEAEAEEEAEEDEEAEEADAETVEAEDAEETEPEEAAAAETEKTEEADDGEATEEEKEQE